MTLDSGFRRNDERTGRDESQPLHEKLPRSKVAYPDLSAWDYGCAASAGRYCARYSRK